MYDAEALTSPVTEFDPLTADQCELARRTVCGHARDAEDAALLMSALGIFPGQEDEAVALIPVTIDTPPMLRNRPRGPLPMPTQFPRSSA